MGNPLATPWWTCANLGVGVSVKALDLRIDASTNCSDPLLFIFSLSRSSSSCILRSITLAVSSTLSFLSLFYFFDLADRAFDLRLLHSAFNAWHLPFAGSRSYDNTGHKYDVDRILKIGSVEFDQQYVPHPIPRSSEEERGRRR